MADIGKMAITVVASDNTAAGLDSATRAVTQFGANVGGKALDPLGAGAAKSMERAGDAVKDGAGGAAKDAGKDMKEAFDLFKSDRLSGGIKAAATAAKALDFSTPVQGIQTFGSTLAGLPGPLGALGAVVGLVGGLIGKWIGPATTYSGLTAKTRKDFEAFLKAREAASGIADQFAGGGMTFSAARGAAQLQDMQGVLDRFRETNSGMIGQALAMGGDAGPFAAVRAQLAESFRGQIQQIREAGGPIQRQLNRIFGNVQGRQMFAEMGAMRFEQETERSVQALDQQRGALESVGTEATRNAATFAAMQATGLSAAEATVRLGGAIEAAVTAQGQLAGAQMRQRLMTPIEQMQRQVAELQDMAGNQFIDPETLGRGLAQQLDMLERANGEMQRSSPGAMLQGSAQALTALRNAQRERERTNEDPAERLRRVAEQSRQIQEAQRDYQRRLVDLVQSGQFSQVVGGF